MQPDHQLLRQIPKVDDCLKYLTADPSHQDIPVRIVKKCIRKFLDELRKQILSGSHDPLLLDDTSKLFNKLSSYIVNENKRKFRRIINGTGVIVHTNLGRSILPESTMDTLYSAGAHYSNLEFDLTTGERGSRYNLVEELLLELTGAEAALVVNNNAAAVLIVLDTLAKGREAIVSRGQLVEIGGSFRIPDVMSRSGALLVEVGATNRTHLRDYESAITEGTGLLLKVHCSNYRIIGFTKEVTNEELVSLGRKNNIPVMEDLGSGCLVDLSQFGLLKEPTVQEVVDSGVDIVTFSGDKLLGGPQAGIIVGRKEYIDRIKSNPLNRALRIDKFTLAGLESILRLYLNEKEVFVSIPTLAMIAASLESVAARAQTFLNCSAELDQYCTIEIVDVASRVGGGAMPEQNLPSQAIAIKPKAISLHLLESALRELELPIVGRVEEGRLLFDMRTIGDDEVPLLSRGLNATFNSFV